MVQIIFTDFRRYLDGGSVVYMYEKLFGAENTGDVVRDAGISAAIGVMLCLFIVAVFTIVNRFIKDDDLEF